MFHNLLIWIFLIGLQVNRLKMKADHLSMIDNAIVDLLVQKVNKYVKVDKSPPPTNEIAYREKLDYLQRLASSRGKPVC